MQNLPLPDDILKLGDLTDASLLDTLQQRFAAKKIYAAAGNSILVSLNPFAWQKGLFSVEASRPYHAARALGTDRGASQHVRAEAKLRQTRKAVDPVTDFEPIHV